VLVLFRFFGVLVSYRPGQPH